MKEEKFIKEKARLPIISKVIFAAAFLLAVFLLALLVQSYIDKKTNGTQKASAIVVMASSIDESALNEPVKENKEEVAPAEAEDVTVVEEVEIFEPALEEKIEVIAQESPKQEEEIVLIEDVQETIEVAETKSVAEQEPQEQAEVKDLPLEQNDEQDAFENEPAQEDLAQEAVEDEVNEQVNSEETAKDVEQTQENQEQPVELVPSVQEEEAQNEPEKVSRLEKEKYIAVVIDDMGISEKRTRDMISLQVPLTSSFLTYGKDLNGLCEEAIKAGHEVMLHVAMEPKGEASLAPDTLTISMSDEQIKKNFLKMLSKFEGIDLKGVNNHMGSLFTEIAPKLDVVMNVLKEKNMFFLDSRTSENTQGKAVAAIEDVPYVERDVFLDNENDYQYIMKQFAKVEKIASQKGYAVAIGHPKSKTFAALRDWLETLPNKEIKLVHLSEIVDMTSQEN